MLFTPKDCDHHKNENMKDLPSYARWTFVYILTNCFYVAATALQGGLTVMFSKILIHY